MNFNELMQRMRDLDTTPEVSVAENLTDGCGMPGMDNMPSSMMGAPKQQDSVTMNVSMNGAGAGGIRDLMAILKNIDDVADKGPVMDLGEPEKFGDRDMDVIVKKQPGMDMMTIDDDYENEPDEIYQDQSAVTGTGNDLHSKGGEAPPVNGGGNPMKVRTGETFKLPAGDLKIRLENLYNNIKLRASTSNKSFTEGYYDLNDPGNVPGMEPIDLSSKPNFKEIITRYTQLVYQGHAGTTSDEEEAEYNDIVQYVADRFGEKGSTHLQKAGEISYWGRSGPRGGSGPRGDNLGRASQSGGDFRTTKAGKMHGQDANAMKSKVSGRLGKHPEPKLPEGRRGQY